MPLNGTELELSPPPSSSSSPRSSARRSRRSPGRAPTARTPPAWSRRRTRVRQQLSGEPTMPAPAKVEAAVTALAERPRPYGPRRCRRSGRRRSPRSVPKRTQPLTTTGVEWMTPPSGVGCCHATLSWEALSVPIVVSLDCFAVAVHRAAQERPLAALRLGRTAGGRPERTHRPARIGRPRRPARLRVCGFSWRPWPLRQFLEHLATRACSVDLVRRERCLLRRLSDVLHVVGLLQAVDGLAIDRVALSVGIDVVGLARRCGRGCRCGSSAPATAPAASGPRRRRRARRAGCRAPWRRR